MLDVVLFTKEGCHLCEEVKAELNILAEQFPHRLREIDITTDQNLLARYRVAIPVVRVGEVELQAPISIEDLASAFRRSSAV